MRLSARNVDAGIIAVPGTERPVRMRAAGLTYCMTLDEAIALANQLADAVSEVKKQPR
jgi:hypothetical protein